MSSAAVPLPSTRRSDTSPDTRTCLIVGITALLTRACFALLFAANPLGRYLYLDSRLYDQMALAIVAGRPAPGAFFVEPLYAYVLALTYWLAGHQIWLPRALQAASGALTAVLACGIGGRLYGRRAAWCAGLGVALYGPLVFYDAMILKTSLEVFAFTAIAALATFLLGTARAFSTGARQGLWLFVGSLLGVSTLLRGNFLILAPLLAFAAWRSAATSRRRSLGAMAAFALGLLVPLAPLLVYNHARSGKWILTTGVGMNLYQGNRAGAAGGLEIPSYIQADPEHEEADSIAEASRRAGRSLTAAEASSFWFGEATRFIASEPGAWLHLMSTKIAMFWNHFEAADDLSFPYARGAIPFLWVPFLGFWLVGSLGLAGTLAALRRSTIERELAVMILLWMVSVVLFHVADRYRLAALPVLVVLGCGFVESLCRNWRPDRQRALLACLALLAATTALVNLPDFYPGGQDEAPFDRVMAVGYADDGRRELAAEYNRRAAEGFSRSAAQCLARGEVYRAEIYLRAVLDADPAFPGAHYNHGLALERLGRVPEAVTEYERAVAGDSAAVEALTHLGRLHLAAGALDAAEQSLNEALRREPERFLALVALGDLRVRQQRIDDARALYERALRQQPKAQWLRDRIAGLPR